MPNEFVVSVPILENTLMKSIGDMVRTQVCERRRDYPCSNWPAEREDKCAEQQQHNRTEWVTVEYGRRAWRVSVLFHGYSRRSSLVRVSTCRVEIFAREWNAVLAGVLF